MIYDLQAYNLRTTCHKYKCYATSFLELYNRFYVSYRKIEATLTFDPSVTFELEGSHLISKQTVQIKKMFSITDVYKSQIKKIDA